MGVLSERQRKMKQAKVKFCDNRNVTAIDLCAKVIKPQPNPKAKKHIPKGNMIYAIM